VRSASTWLHFNAEHMRRQIVDMIDDAQAGIRIVVLDFSSVPAIDITAGTILRELIRTLKDRGIRIELAELRDDVLETLKIIDAEHDLGPLELIGPSRIALPDDRINSLSGVSRRMLLARPSIPSLIDIKTGATIDAVSDGEVGVLAPQRVLAAVEATYHQAIRGSACGAAQYCGSGMTKLCPTAFFLPLGLRS